MITKANKHQSMYDGGVREEPWMMVLLMTVEEELKEEDRREGEMEKR